MGPGGIPRAVALGLALQLLLGFGLGLEAALILVPTQTQVQIAGPSASSCPPNNFQCHASGYCVPLSWRCDGVPDCFDGSDEEECSKWPGPVGFRIEPLAVLPCSCENISNCPGSSDNLHNCSRQPCQEGEVPCTVDNVCIPHTWRCDGHPDCPDFSDELSCETNTESNKILQEETSTTTGTPVTLENATSLWNATAASVGDPSGNPSAYGIIAAGGLLSAILVSGTLLLLLRLRGQGHLPPSGLLVVVKESLLLSERKTSLL